MSDVHDLNYIDHTMWSNLLGLALEAASTIEDDAERDFVLRVLKGDLREVVEWRREGNHIHLYVAGRRLVAAHALALTKPLTASNN